MTTCFYNCEAGCETGSEVTPHDLWPLVPFITRYRDSLASGSPDAEGNFQKVVQVFAEEFGTTEREIRALADIINVDATSPDYLMYLSATLGTMVGPTTQGEDFQRWFIRNLVYFYKIKGTHPSWDRQFKWLTDTWYKAWELFKTTYYETGDYSRTEDLVYPYKAARFDLYTGDEFYSAPSFIDIPTASGLTRYIEAVRPIHVLLRKSAVIVDLDDTLPLPDETDISAEITAHFYDDAPPISESLQVEITCLATCESSCQDTCEMGCEFASCEFACQASCTGQVEVEFICDLDCASSCESSSCQGSCQAGSCQAGCQSCDQLELFVAEIKDVEEATENDYRPPTDWNLRPQARIYMPRSIDLTTSDIDESSWITPEEESDWVRLKFLYDCDEPCYFEPNPNASGQIQLAPDVETDSWHHVRCENGGEYSQDHTQKGDGTLRTWGGSISHQPHPCKCRLEAHVAEAKTAIDGVASGQTVHVADSSDFSKGDIVEISDDDNLVVNIIDDIMGNTMLLHCPLGMQFWEDKNGEVLRRESKMVAHVTEMEEPEDDETWYGEFHGDVDEDETNRLNFRGVYGLACTFRDPPPRGATITVYYTREQDCSYWLLDTYRAAETETMWGKVAALAGRQGLPVRFKNSAVVKVGSVFTCYIAKDGDTGKIATNANLDEFYAVVLPSGGNSAPNLRTGDMVGFQLVQAGSGPYSGSAVYRATSFTPDSFLGDVALQSNAATAVPVGWYELNGQTVYDMSTSASGVPVGRMLMDARQTLVSVHGDKGHDRPVVGDIGEVKVSIVLWETLPEWNEVWSSYFRPIERID